MLLFSHLRQHSGLRRLQSLLASIPARYTEGPLLHLPLWTVSGIWDGDSANLFVVDTLRKTLQRFYALALPCIATLGDTAYLLVMGKRQGFAGLLDGRESIDGRRLLRPREMPLLTNSSAAEPSGSYLRSIPLRLGMAESAAPYPNHGESSVRGTGLLLVGLCREGTCRGARGAKNPAHSSGSSQAWTNRKQSGRFTATPQARLSYHGTRQDTP